MLRVCSDCDTKINLPEDSEVGDLVQCPSCCCDHEVYMCKKTKNLEIKPYDYEGEDWGE